MKRRLWTIPLVPRLPWRALGRWFFPPARAWSSLSGDAVTYPLGLAIVGSVVAKLRALRKVAPDMAPDDMMRVVSHDLAIFLLAASVGLWLNAWRPSLRWLVVPTTTLLAVYGVLNAIYFLLSGEQGDWQALQDLWHRQAEAAQVLQESLAQPDVLLAGLCAAASLIGTPLALRRLTQGGGASLAVQRSQRARAATTLALSACVVALVLPTNSQLVLRRLERNAVAGLLHSAWKKSEKTAFRGYVPAELVPPTALREFEPTLQKPNVLIIVLESTRYDFTSLAGDRAKAKTPHLAALASEGLVAHKTRAVLPHTTKSLFSILCGRLPAMDKSGVEPDASAPVQCLPELANLIGYRTGFFQSAFGTFEQRPRLADKLGFASFRAWEDIQGTKLGYLASDDRTLTKPLMEWIDRTQPGEKPFFGVVLTSATHHPYRLSEKAQNRAKRQKLAMERQEDRYARLVEEADLMIGDMVKELRTRNLLDQTVVAIVGDHGEGFGDHIILGHDNIFFDEGLRVPLVLRGPGVPIGTYDGNASLVDLTPTIMGLWGLVTPPELAGFDLLHPPADADRRPRDFGCFNPLHCRGFVAGDYKVVKEPNTGETWLFNLRRDPRENHALALTDKMLASVRALDQRFRALRVSSWDYERQPLVRYKGWYCPEKVRFCFHARAFNEKNKKPAAEISRANRLALTYFEPTSAPLCWPDPVEPALSSANHRSGH